MITQETIQETYRAKLSSHVGIIEADKKVAQMADDNNDPFGNMLIDICTMAQEIKQEHSFDDLTATSIALESWRDSLTQEILIK